MRVCAILDLLFLGSLKSPRVSEMLAPAVGPADPYGAGCRKHPCGRGATMTDFGIRIEIERLESEGSVCAR